MSAGFSFNASTPSEYARVGFAYANDGRLYNIKKQIVESELLKHHADIAVEVAHEHHRMILVYAGQHLAAVTRLSLHLFIKVFEYGLMAFYIFIL